MTWPINVRIFFVFFGLYTFINFPTDVLNKMVPLTILIVGSLIVFFSLYWADSYERETKEIILYFLLWGALVSTGLSAIVFGLFENFANNIFAAALIEEVSKLIFFIFLLKHKIVSWWTDGLVAGGLIGLGFTLLEDIYYLSFFENSAYFAIERVLFSVFAHSFFTGIAGAFIAYLWISNRKLLIWFPILMATFIHFIWNYSAVNFFDKSYSLHLAIPPLMVFLLALYLRNQEKKILEKITKKKNIKLKWDRQIYIDLKKRRQFRNHLNNTASRKYFDKEIHNQIHELLIKEWKN